MRESPPSHRKRFDDVLDYLRSVDPDAGRPDAPRDGPAADPSIVDWPTAAHAMPALDAGDAGDALKGGGGSDAGEIAIIDDVAGWHQPVAPPPPARPTSSRRVVVFLTIGLGVVLLAGAQQTGGSPASLGAPAASPYVLKGRDEYTSLIAQANSPAVPVFAAPGGHEEPFEIPDHPTRSGAPLVFLVVDDANAEWLQVQLPIGPNGKTGWIRRDDVGIRATRYRVRVILGEHRLELHEGAELVFSTAIGVGRKDTPAPGERFFVKELIEPSSPGTIYGSHVFGLSGFSNILESFNSGAGVIGIHGTNDPSSIGQDVSHGCIRLANAALQELVGRLPLGTPVDIVA